MQVVWWGRFLDFMQVQWRRHKGLLAWLLVWLVAGIVFGIVTLYIGDVTVDDINYRLIDGNILNATSGSAGIGSFMWQRVLSIIIPVVVVFVLAWLSRVTAWAIFPVVLMHGYWLAVAVWWTFFYYQLPALLVLAFYIVWLLLVTAVLLCGLLWAWQCGHNLRAAGGRDCGTGRIWSGIWRGAVILIVVAVVMGVFEYLVFWTVLGKIVYKPL